MRWYFQRSMVEPSTPFSWYRIFKDREQLHWKERMQVFDKRIVEESLLTRFTLNFNNIEINLIEEKGINYLQKSNWNFLQLINLSTLFSKKTEL